jgi:hypothetical protein
MTKYFSFLLLGKNKNASLVNNFKGIIMKLKKIMLGIVLMTTSTLGLASYHVCVRDKSDYVLYFCTSHHDNCKITLSSKCHRIRRCKWISGGQTMYYKFSSNKIYVYAKTLCGVTLEFKKVKEVTLSKDGTTLHATRDWVECKTPSISVSFASKDYRKYCPRGGVPVG